MDVPRRPPPTDQERVNVAVKRYIAGAAAGGTRFAKPITRGPYTQVGRRATNSAIFGLAQWRDVRAAQTCPGFAVTDDLIVESGGAASTYSQFGGVDSVELLVDGHYQAAAAANIAGATPGNEFRIEVTVPQWGTYAGGAAIADALGEAQCFVLSPVFFADVIAGGDETIQAYIAQLSGTGATFQQATITLTRFN